MITVELNEKKLSVQNDNAPAKSAVLTPNQKMRVKNYSVRSVKANINLQYIIVQKLN